MGVLVIHARSKKRGARQENRSTKASPRSKIREIEEGEEI
jgi:hypothetical protein